MAGLGWYPCGRLKHRLVFYSSTITMVHGPIYMRDVFSFKINM